MSEEAYVIPPDLTDDHVRGAKLYANRYAMAAALPVRKGAVIAEVGVALGHFSNVLIDAITPSKFVAFDTFNLHQHELIWGEPSKEIFNGKTHLEYYKSKFPSAEYEVGNSHELLPRYPDNFFDLIYIDAGHEYKDVKVDTVNAAKKVKNGGVLVFNDYLMFDHLAGIHYGVVRAANELIAGGGWRVVGLALHSQMFCDLAVQRV